LTLGVFQNLLGNSVNSESLKASSFLDLFWCERVGSSNEPLKFAEFLSKDSVNFERQKGWKKYPPGSKIRNFGVRKKAISHPCHKGSCFFEEKRNAPILVNYVFHSPSYDLQTHIGGRHPVLYFHYPEKREI